MSQPGDLPPTIVTDRLTDVPRPHTGRGHYREGDPWRLRCLRVRPLSRRSRPPIRPRPDSAPGNASHDASPWRRSHTSPLLSRRSQGKYPRGSSRVRMPPYRNRTNKPSDDSNRAPGSNTKGSASAWSPASSAHAISPCPPRGSRTTQAPRRWRCGVTPATPSSSSPIACTRPFPSRRGSAASRPSGGCTSFPASRASCRDTRR